MHDLIPDYDRIIQESNRAVELEWRRKEAAEFAANPTPRGYVKEVFRGAWDGVFRLVTFPFRWGHYIEHGEWDETANLALSPFGTSISWIVSYGVLAAAIGLRWRLRKPMAAMAARSSLEYTPEAPAAGADGGKPADETKVPMRRFTIVGLQRGTESDVRVEIEAANEGNARAKAEHRGILVTEIIAPQAPRRITALRPAATIPLAFLSGLFIAVVIESLRSDAIAIGTHAFAVGAAFAILQAFRTLGQHLPHQPSPSVRDGWDDDDRI
jgi:hypothetical protein